MNEERLIQALAALFVLGTYGATFWISAKSQRSVVPYALILGLHTVVALGLLMESLSREVGGDAAGNGLRSGLLWLCWLASSIGFGCVTWLVFFVARLAFPGAPNVRAD